METRQVLINVRKYAAPCICGGMIACTLAVIRAYDVARKNFDHDLSSYLWIFGPYAAVGIVSSLVRKNVVASAFGLIAAILTALMTIFGLYPELSRESGEMSRIGVVIIGLCQWMLIGALTVVGLFSVLIHHWLSQRWKQSRDGAPL